MRWVKWQIVAPLSEMHLVCNSRGTNLASATSNKAHVIRPYGRPCANSEHLIPRDE